MMILYRLYTMYEIIIKGGVVVTASDVGCYDIGVKDGKIAALLPDIPVDQGAEIIYAE